ncbi:unnamed protein product, partial [Oikopleura dioica]
LFGTMTVDSGAISSFTSEEHLNSDVSSVRALATIQSLMKISVLRGQLESVRVTFVVFWALIYALRADHLCLGQSKTKPELRSIQLFPNFYAIMAT